MNERGINSFEEFLLFYLAAGLVVGALWVILEADVLLGPMRTLGERRLRQRRIARLLAPLGVLHPGFALISLDANRRDDAVDGTGATEPSVEVRRRRAASEARACAFAGVAVLFAICLPHLPGLSEFPAVDTFAEVLPWE